MTRNVATLSASSSARNCDFLKQLLYFHKSLWFSALLLAISGTIGWSQTTEATLLRYEFSLKKELPIFAASAAGILTSSLMTNTITPFREIDLLTPVDFTGSTWDRRAIDNFSPKSAEISDLLLYSSVLLPTIPWLSTHHARHTKGYILLGAETLIVTYALTDLTKVIALRDRPTIYNDRFTIAQRTSKDARKSFFSGHTSIVSSMSFLTAKIIHDHYPDRKNKSLLWIGASIYPTTTAILRVRSGKHFPTDVVVGAAVGAGIGILIPELHRVKLGKTSDKSLSFTGNGCSFIWAID